jgi:CDP-diacylglycerol--serine O-phosphatidyltransferase
MRVPPEMVLPVFVSAVFFIALLIGYPWYILSIGTVIYLLSLPLGWKSYRNHQRKAEALTTPTFVASPPAEPPSPFLAAVDDDDRPARLN